MIASVPWGKDNGTERHRAMVDVDSEDGMVGGMTPIALVDCGLEDLVAALLHEQPVVTPEGDSPFVLENDDARRILAYYARRRDLWPRTKNVQVREIEDVLRALEDDPPPVKATRIAGAAGKRLWTLRRVEAHRFAGLHRHCGADGEDPEDFVFEIDRDVTLIRGFNGAGKTALQNVIIWCLTGRALRSQHLPEEIHEPMQVYRSESDEDDGGRESGFKLPPVVPIPSGADLDALDDKPRIDTWARLTFHEEASGQKCVVRRTLTVGAQGKIGMAVTGLEELELPDLAVEVGTLIPGIAAHMRFDDKTTLTNAIAQLTGLKPLEDLGRRSARMVKRLRQDVKGDTERQAAARLSDFKSKRQNILDAWTVRSDLGDPAALIAPDEDTEQGACRKSITDTRADLERTRQELGSRAESVLGQASQLATRDGADTLSQRLAKASEGLKGSELNVLPSIGTIRNLRAVSNEDIEVAEALIAEMAARAKAVSERLRNKREAARWQLYTRVAAWHREHHNGAGFETCPVCGTDLNEVPPDALLDKDVKEALLLCGEADSDAAKGAEDWERDAAREFLDKLPESLRRFADEAPSPGLLQIYRNAFVDELLADSHFGGALQLLKQNVETVWELATTENPLPPVPETDPAIWPDEFQNGTLVGRGVNVEQAIRLAKHRKTGATAIKGMVERYIGRAGTPEGKEPEAAEAGVEASLLPLCNQVEALRLCVTNSKPILSLLEQLDGLETVRKGCAELNNRLERIGKAADAMEAFADFENLVSQQVSGLVNALDRGTQSWLERIYSSHYHGGPAYSGFNAAEEKGLGLRAGIGDMRVPAYKIMNAAQLRACVWAFVFSLWEHVRSKVGGIDCILLDDPQNQFDPINAENLAAAIPVMPEHGMRPVVTSSDHRFLAGIRDKLPRRATGSPSWQALVMNPVSSSRLTAGVGPDGEEIVELRKDWLADRDNEDKARKFVSMVRIYVENRLWGLLATDPMVRCKPTLADLLQSLRSAHNNGERPFDEVPFMALLSHASFRDAAPFVQLINKAHHRPQDLTPNDAKQVDDAFNEIEQLMRCCSASYARFMGRLTHEDRDLFLYDLPPAPEPVPIKKEAVQILGAVSARSSSDVLATDEAVELLDFAELGDIAFYVVRSPGLGLLSLQGQVVMVSLEMEARNGDPVVGLNGDRMYLRRLSADQRRAPSSVILTCDQTGTESVPPSLILPKARTRLLPVIGVLYDQQTFAGKDEVVATSGSRLLERDLVAARVTDDSAYPVIRGGDLVLMESVANLDAEALTHLEDRIVVVVAGNGSESFSYLKRIGGQVTPGIRILENVGLKGSALPIAMSEDTAPADVLFLQKLWRVHGTLRQRTDM